MIIEYEDFEKYVAQQEWGFIRDQYKDGEKDFFDKTTGNHKEFEELWFIIGCFREKHGIPHTCRNPKGEPITEAEYWEIREQYEKKYSIQKDSSVDGGSE